MGTQPASGENLTRSRRSGATVMRRFLPILFFFILQIAAVTGSASVLIGTVASVNRGDGALILLQENTRRTVRVSVPAGKVPGGIRKGIRIRIWGDFSGDASGRFNARKMEIVPASTREKDPTGVRSRLHKGRRMKPESP